MRGLPSLLAACLLIALAPHASATAVDPFAALPWQPHVSSEDRDGDGHDEHEAHWLAFGPCGCYCPVAGGEVEVEAAGQKITVLAATAIVLCGVLVDADVDPDEADPTAMPSAGHRLILYGPVLGDLEPAIVLN
ncbi:MAG: hypothetical protein ACPGQL_02335 [Thermoplasmatota archaeon]